jgi:methionyl-tRNA formyltransferase
MGTPDFSVPSLNALIEMRRVAGRPAEVVGVFTQPDRPSGRGQNVAAPPVKRAALAAGVPVYQPERLRRSEGLTALESLSPDLVVVAAYAQILPRRVLDLPRFGCLNVHASLLPRFRGASPIQAAILEGDAETGATIMLMDEGLDTGPILSQARLPIGARDTAESLAARLSTSGADLLADTVPRWIAGNINPSPQDEARATKTGLLKKEYGVIDWATPAVFIERQVRAMFPWPAAFTPMTAGPLRVLQSRVGHDPVHADLIAGTVVARDAAPAVVTGEGLLVLEMVQPAGRRPMAGAEWIRGAPHVIGAVLGTGTGSP